jgi:integrase
VSASKASAGPFKRHKTRHRGITYRVKADGTRTYYVYAAGKHLAVEGGEKEAVAKQAELRGKVARGGVVAPRSVRFAELAEEWFASKDKLRPWTKSGYRSALDRVLLPRFGKRKIAQITVDDVLRLIHDLERDGLSRSTIYNVLKPISGTFRYAAKKGFVSQSPVALLDDGDKPRHRPHERREWTPEEIRALLAASRELASRPTARFDYSLLLETAVRTGLRLGELLGLQWRDIDFDGALLVVRRQWTRTGEYSEPKTAKGIRRIPLAPALVKRLAAHKLASRYSGDEDPVFASAKGKPLSHRNVAQRGFQPAAIEAGLVSADQPRLTFHDLRHAFASIMIERGVSSTVLANLMGHTTSSTTERIYIHLFNRQRSDERVRAAMEEAMVL